MSSELNEVFQSDPLKGQKNPIFYTMKAPEVPLQIKKMKVVEIPRLVNIIDTIANNSEFGRAVLEDAANAGYGITFEYMSACGYCEKESKMIALNPALSDDLLIATLAHESRHAQQFVHGANDDFGMMNLKSEIMNTRAEEADAETAAAATCFEMKKNGVDGPWKAFASDSPEISSEFLKASDGKNDQVTDKMLQAAFNGWFKDIKTVEAYEQSYYQDVMDTAMDKGKEFKYPYDKEVSSKEIVTMFCHNAKGECYWKNNLDVMNEFEKLSVCAKTINIADEFFRTREEKNGTAMDDSYLQLPVRDPKFLNKDTRHQEVKSEVNRNAQFVRNVLQAKKLQR